MPKKPIKYGIKAFTLADSDEGYVVNILLYTGSETLEVVSDEWRKLPQTTQVVVHLMEPYAKYAKNLALWYVTHFILNNYYSHSINFLRLYVKLNPDAEYYKNFHKGFRTWIKDTSPVILSKILGEHCNKSKLNGICFLNMSTITDKISDY